MSTNQKFKDFVFKNNKDWQEYKRKITETNLSVGKSQLKKLKMKWYKNTIDPSFNPEQYQEWENTQTSKSTKQPEETKRVPDPRENTRVPDPRENTRVPDPRQQSTNISLKDNFLRWANLWTVLLYVTFFVTFFLRLSAGVYFWQYAIWASLLAYSISLSKEAVWPQTPSFQSLMQTFAELSQKANFQYCFYCITLLYTQHISLVAITPLAIYGLFNSITFWSPLLSILKNYRFLGEISNLVQLSTKYKSSLRFWAAACEVLTFLILIWKYFMGYNRDIFLVHLFLMFQFLIQRYNSSTDTKDIISTVYYKIKTFLPKLPNLPNLPNMTQ